MITASGGIFGFRCVRYVLGRKGTIRINIGSRIDGVAIGGRFTQLGANWAFYEGTAIKASGP